MCSMFVLSKTKNMCNTNHTYANERFTKDGKAMHTCNGDVITGLPFGRKAPEGECRRCDELRNGAAPREAWDAQKKQNEARRTEYMRKWFAPGGRHDQIVAAGEIDTAFEW